MMIQTAKPLTPDELPEQWERLPLGGATMSAAAVAAAAAAACLPAAAVSAKIPLPENRCYRAHSRRLCDMRFLTYSISFTDKASGA